jgi:hypothetical protein
MPSRGQAQRGPRGLVVATHGRRHWHYRTGFAVTIVLLLFTGALLPMTLASVVANIQGPPQGRQFLVSAVPRNALSPTHTDLQLQLIQLDEVQQLATLRVIGYHICETACAWSARVQFYSLIDELDAAGLPPSVSITLPPSRDAVTQTIQLPIQGLPLRYPFDEYTLQLGLVLDRVLPDGTVQSLPPAEAPSHLFVTVQERLAQHTMDAPTPVESTVGQDDDNQPQYIYLTKLNLHRLLHVQVLAVLLVLLITAAAAYAVFLRPFQDLVINAGALIIGIWGIRAILTPANLTYVTAVDLSLSVVILFLLGAITVRAVMFLYQRSELHWFRRAPS